MAASSDAYPGTRFSPASLSTMATMPYTTDAKARNRPVLRASRSGAVEKPRMPLEASIAILRRV